MTVFDYVVLVIIGLSLLLSVMRGLVREALALAGWLIAFAVAIVYTADLAPLLAGAIDSHALRLLAAFIILLVAVLLIMGLVSLVISKLVKTVGLTTLDRCLGAFFGLARGLLIVMVLVLLAGLTALPRQEFWRNAVFSTPLETAATSLKIWLPEDLSKRIRYN